MANPILDAALDYVRRGWPVLALLPAKKHPRRGKPAGYVPADGSSFLNAKDADTVRQWWGEYPGDDVGIETGRVAGFWVLDIDGDDGEAALADLVAKYGELPRTVTSRSGSGNGRHFLFRHPGFKVKTKARWHGLPIDTKGDGGQFVAPPSSHKSGNRYQWLIGLNECEIADAPAWLLDWFKPEPVPAPVTLRPTIQDDDTVIDRARLYVQRMDPSIDGCRGSPAALKVARALRWGYCLDESTAFDIFVSEFNDRCEPPWSEKEILHKLADGAKPDPMGRPFGYIRDAEYGGADSTQSTEWVDGITDGKPKGGDGAEEMRSTTTATDKPAESDDAATIAPAGDTATDKPAVKTCPNCEQETADPVCECGFELTPKIEDTATAPVEAAEPIEAAAEPIEEREPDLSPADPGPFPADIATDAPGMLGELVAYDQHTSEKPQPALALAGALSVLSVITGRKLAGRRDTRTNLLMVGLAQSGDGKSHARDWARRLLAHASAGDLIGPQRFGSHAGIISWLNDHPAAFFPIDEFGDLLALMKQTGMKLGAVGNIEPLLKALYSSANDPAWIGDALARADHVKTINQRHLVLYGTCPPSHYWGNLTAANIENGLLARFIVFEAVKVRPVTRNTVDPFPPSIVERVRRWFRFSPGPENALNPVPVIATYTEAALTMLSAHAQAIFDKGEKEDERTTAIWNRCAEKTSKLALIAAASRINDPAADTVTVTESDVAWAKRLAVYTTRRMVWRIFESVADNAEEERKKALLRLIPEWPGRINASALTRKTQKLKRSERNSAIEDLLAGGFVGQERVLAGKSGPAKTFYWRNNPKSRGGIQR